MTYCYLVLSLIMVLTLAGCGSTFQKAVRKDSAPTLKIDPKNLRDAIPRQDIITRAGNKNPYTVLGKTYHLLSSSKGYKARGVASWYGTKFQGRPTANGEPYNLYAMTAAHRSLMIPTYVKVTNLENGRTAVVRINDRGPFHDDRIIDLSYAAAVKLGYANKGTALVQVEAIDIKSNLVNRAPRQSNDLYILQAGAFKSLQLANKLQAYLQLKLNRDVTIKTSQPAGYYQVQIGPITQLSDVQQVSEQLLALGLGRPHLISQ